MVNGAYSSGLIDRLPLVRGRYTARTPLARTTWFQVGGESEIMFWPADVEDLTHFLATRPADVPVMVIGVGSNLLVRDGGVPGVIIRLGRCFAAITVETGGRLHCGAAALDANVAAIASMAGVGGLEFLSGIPGSIGGALCMNAGAYGTEIRNVLVETEAVDGRGQRHRVGPTAFSYRHAAIAKDWVFIGAVLQGYLDSPAAVAARIAKMRLHREESQPLRTRTCGSTFKNPKGARAWELIDNAGCRGLQRGGAMVSGKHCNFLINTGGATAADIEALGEEVRRRVWETSGITLEWEVRRIGQPILPGVGLEGDTPS
ncbi:UDP-N-acetylenolpyruvoylglucosamine reductase [invertebrate metagenome]|uniref:UDP-N-acetylmuramate dehydrogenase n=1 Tax=invertebrate metagenome TaxID=1711999 RepID=A0A484HAR8_9ZZZZ